jgi:hypothetical protein
MGVVSPRGAFQEFAQDDSVVVRGILRREKQSKCLGLTRSISQFGGGWILLQFSEIAGAELRPFFRVVRIPAPQHIAWRASLIQASMRASSRAIPRGHSRSTNIRVPSEVSGGS